MVRVLFFIPTLGHGGAERVLVNLVNHMDRNRFQVTVQTMFDVGIYQEKLESHVRYIGGFPWYFRGNTIAYKFFSPEQLFRMYIKEEYDLIVSYLEGPSARVIGGTKSCQAKRICWMHIQLDTEQYVSQAFRNMNEVMKCYSRFDRFVCVSNTVKETVLNMIHPSVPVEVLYNTVETAVIKEKAEEPIEYGLFSADEINIISVAKLMKSKGYDRLARVQRRLINDGFPTHIYLVGKGEEHNSLEKQIQSLEIQSSWTFLGFQENPYKYVKNADLYVCSSRKEGFSTAVTEALIVGTPVVSTRCSGAEELLGYHDEYGIVTDNDEEALYLGIKKMIGNSQTLEEYRHKARERGAKFSTEDTVQAVEKLLIEVAAQ